LFSFAAVFELVLLVGVPGSEAGVAFRHERRETAARRDGLIVHQAGQIFEGCDRLPARTFSLSILLILSSSLFLHIDLKIHTPISSFLYLQSLPKRQLLFIVCTAILERI
jgi:hypothetical protein